MYTTQTLQPAAPGTVLAAHKGVKIYVNRDHELALQDPHDVPGLRKYGRVKDSTAFIGHPLLARAGVHKVEGRTVIAFTSEDLEAGIAEAIALIDRNAWLRFNSAN